MDAQILTGDPSDACLATRILAGDRAAEFELDRRWRGRLLAIARAILGDDHLAEDAAQVAMWRVLRNLHLYNPLQPFEKWTLAIGRHATLDILRRKQARPEAGDTRCLGGQSGTPDDSFEHVTRKEELEGLRHCLSTLRDENRSQAVALKMAGFSLSETGRMLARSKSVIQGWLESALEHLRRCMAGRGFSGL